MNYNVYWCIDSGNENGSNTENIPIADNIDFEKKFNINNPKYIADNAKPDIMYYNNDNNT